MRFRTSLHGATALLLLAGAFACQQLESNHDGDLNASTATSLDQGRALFDVHCTVCHGSNGRGDGTAAPFLFPPARDFAQGFRLVTASNGAPSDEDLINTLKRGMPGSAMPSWNWLSAQELSSLAGYVRELATLGLVDELSSRGEPDDRLDEATALAEARRKLTPGVRVVTPTLPGDIEHGRELYMQSCAPCHEKDGSGSPVPLFTASNELTWARDFTAGFMKGSASKAALAARIQAGMPGSEMPATNYSDPQDLADIVAFVGSLIPEGSDYRLVHRRQEITVERVSTSIPLDPNHPDWHNASEVLITLAPLWWQNESVLQASISALHDGKDFAVRLRWNDRVGGPGTFGNTPLPDAAALQFSTSSAPPLFGMGSPQTPTTIWHWKSQDSIQTAGELDQLTGLRRNPQRSDANPDQLIADHGMHSGRVVQTDGTGVQNVSPDERAAGGVRVIANWDQAEWEVIFIRALEPKKAEETGLAAGSRIQMASSIWNGEAADIGGHKSISIWHELVFEP